MKSLFDLDRTKGVFVSKTGRTYTFELNDQGQVKFDSLVEVASAMHATMQVTNYLVNGYDIESRDVSYRRYEAVNDGFLFFPLKVKGNIVDVNLDTEPCPTTGYYEKHPYLKQVLEYKFGIDIC